MNEIESEIDAEVVEILVANGQPVEYGEVLFRLRAGGGLRRPGARMFRKILIANRGEIALRIIWACRELGIKTVAVLLRRPTPTRCTSSSPTRTCASARRRSADSYLNISAVISAAEITDAEAIHPGYGFLAENAHFAEVCRECGLTFIGPAPGRDPAHGRQGRGPAHDDRGRRADGPGQRRGRRATPRRRARVAERDRLSRADQGLGRRRRARHAHRREPDELERAVRGRARPRPSAAFGDARRLPREVPRSSRGTSSSRSSATRTATSCTCSSASARSSAGTRSCSRSRPSTALDDDAARAHGRGRARAPRGAVNYVNAGTVEFLLDAERRLLLHRDEHAHPGRAPGDRDGHGHRPDQGADPRSPPASRSSFTQDEVAISGHAIECRINAEDPETLRAEPGQDHDLPSARAGPGIRLDTACYAEAVIPPYYDSMIAKLIARGNTRGEAILRMRRALESFVIEGIKTNLQAAAADPAATRTSSADASRRASWSASARPRELAAA